MNKIVLVHFVFFFWLNAGQMTGKVGVDDGEYNNNALNMMAKTHVSRKRQLKSRNSYQLCGGIG